MSPEPLKEPIHIDLSPEPKSPEPQPVQIQQKFEGLQVSETQILEVGAAAMPVVEHPVISDVSTSIASPQNPKVEEVKVDPQTYKIVSSPAELVESQSLTLSNGFRQYYKEGSVGSKEGIICEVGITEGKHIISGNLIDTFNSSEYAHKVEAVLSGNGLLQKIVLEKPAPGLTLLSQLIQERMERFKAREVLDTINQHQLSRLFLNIIKGLNELLSKGINIQYIVPEAILVNIATGEAKIMLQKSTLLKESPLTLLDSFGMMHPTFDALRYLAPETLEHQKPSNSSLSWAIGIMMYEYVYGINPFTNKNSKMMQALIKRYPVVFPDSDNHHKKAADLDQIGEMRSDGQGEAMPHEFHELIRDLLAKDQNERLGSEEFLNEFQSHSYFTTY